MGQGYYFSSGSWRWGGLWCWFFIDEQRAGDQMQLFGKKNNSWCHWW